MEELQLELEETQRQLDLVKALTLLVTSWVLVPRCPGCQARLQESEKLEEKARTGHSVVSTPSCDLNGPGLPSHRGASCRVRNAVVATPMTIGL